MHSGDWIDIRRGKLLDRCAVFDGESADSAVNNMNHRNPQKPTPDLVREYVAHFEQDNAASDTDKALSKLFRLLPDNRAIEDVLVKVVGVNSLLSTGILATY